MKRGVGRAAGRLEPRERIRGDRRIRMRFWFCGATEKAAVAIAAAKWPDRELGEEFFEHATFFGSMGVRAVTRWTTENHGPYLFSEESCSYCEEVHCRMEAVLSYTANTVGALGDFPLRNRGGRFAPGDDRSRRARPFEAQGKHAVPLREFRMVNRFVDSDRWARCLRRSGQGIVPLKEWLGLVD